MLYKVIYTFRTLCGRNVPQATIASSLMLLNAIWWTAQLQCICSDIRTL